MPEYTFQLRGWHILFGVVLVIGYFGVSTYSRVRPVDDGMRAALREYLLNEYSGRSPGDLQRILTEARNGEPVEKLPDIQQHDVEFPSVSAVGRYGAMYEIVRAQIKVDGGLPPEGDSLRYFRLERIGADKWLVVSKSDSRNYYSQLFPWF